MSKFIKFFSAFLGSIVIGLLIGALIAVAFTETTFSEFFDKLFHLSVMETIGVPLFSIFSVVIAFTIIILTHEAGHLVCGLLTGYKFISFRIFNLTFIKSGNKISMKRFAVAGTGGQCLLSPPDLPLEEIPTGWYNFGGLLVNIILLVVTAPILWMSDNPWVRLFISMFIIVDGILILLNGIPVKINGITNDAGNILMLCRNLSAKRSLVAQLRSNELIQKGVRPKDMPDEIFTPLQEVDYSNPMEVAVPLMRASRLLDMGKIEDAYRSFSELMEHKDKIMGLYVKEIACELAYTALLTGRIDQARNLLDKQLMNYITAYRKVMSSKERLLCAKAIFIDSNPEEALKIYKSLSGRRGEYLLQGEVSSDLALMKSMIDQAGILPGLKIRPSKPEDIERIMPIYDSAKAFMRSQGNLTQWTGGYPSRDKILGDIRSGNHYVMETERTDIVAVFTFIIGEDPTYRHIENGCWLNDSPYGTIHRIASSGQRGNILRTCVDFCFTKINNLRIDTHRDNKKMLSGLKDLGFTECGVIYIDDGSPRIAFQKQR